MKILDYNIYENMSELKELLEKHQESIKLNKEIQDIQYAGTINWIEIDPVTGTHIPTKKDIYICLEKNSNGEIVIKYYDEEKDLLAIDMQNYSRIMPTEKSLDFSYIEMPNGHDFYSQFNNLKYADTLSLNSLEDELEKLSEETLLSKDDIISLIKEKNAELDKISEATGDSKSEIQFISNINDIHKIIKKGENDKIELKDQRETSNKNNQDKPNRNIIPNIKQETDLSQKVNDRFTLGDVLGVPSNGKLIAVYSSAVKDNKNTTKFTFLIQDKDGNLSPCDNLHLVGGNSPTNNVYASNYDGSNVKKEKVYSEYMITGPYKSEGYILTADIGTMGTVEFGLGQAPKTQGMNSSEAAPVTIPLKTTSTYYTKPETRESLLSYHSEYYAADNRAKEAKSHDDTCKLTQEEVDGNKETGEQHLSAEEINLITETTYEEIGQYLYYTRESFIKAIINDYIKGPLTKESLQEACKEFSRERFAIKSRDKNHNN